MRQRAISPNTISSSTESDNEYKSCSNSFNLDLKNNKECIKARIGKRLQFFNNSYKDISEDIKFRVLKNASSLASKIR